MGFGRKFRQDFGGFWRTLANPGSFSQFWVTGTFLHDLGKAVGGHFESAEEARLREVSEQAEGGEGEYLPQFVPGDLIPQDSGANSGTLHVRTDRAVSPGFSGGPVCCPAQRSSLGMAVAAVGEPGKESHFKVVDAIPSSEILFFLQSYGGVK